MLGLKWYFWVLLELFLKRFHFGIYDPLTKITLGIPKYAAYDSTFSHVVEIGKINTETKLETIVIIFERLKKLQNYWIYRFFVVFLLLQKICFI